jgi:hypothetical protein
MKKPTAEELMQWRRTMSQGHRLMHDDANALWDYVARLEDALREIMKVVGTSTMQFHIARRALEGEDG